MNVLNSDLNDLNGFKYYYLEADNSKSTADYLSSMADNSIGLMQTTADLHPSDLPAVYGSVRFTRLNDWRTAVEIFVNGEGQYFKANNISSIVSQKVRQTISSFDLLSSHINIGAIEANKVTVKHVDFEIVFSNTPAVTATLNVITNDPVYNGVSVFVTNVSTTGFDLRLLNNTDREFIATVDWIAMRQI